MRGCNGDGNPDDEMLVSFLAGEYSCPQRCYFSIVGCGSLLLFFELLRVVVSRVKDEEMGLRISEVELKSGNRVMIFFRNGWSWRMVM